MEEYLEIIVPVDHLRCMVDNKINNLTVEETLFCSELNFRWKVVDIYRNSQFLEKLESGSRAIVTFEGEGFQQIKLKAKFIREETL